jgi:putative phosphoribosyl transferase
MDDSRFHREADTVFLNRADAGRQLARRLERFRDSDAVVLGLPRGGVPVAFEVAAALALPLDVIIVRKLGLPFQPEVAMGALGEGGARIIDRPLVAYAGVTSTELQAVQLKERDELDSRVRRLRHGGEGRDLHGRTAIVVDDGIATGATARVACTVARDLGAAHVVLATPVAPVEALDEIVEADIIECVSTPPNFFAVGYHYRDFVATTDAEVQVLLARAGAEYAEASNSDVDNSDISSSELADVEIGDVEISTDDAAEIPPPDVDLPGILPTELHLPDFPPPDVDLLGAHFPGAMPPSAELPDLHAEVSVPVPGAIIEGHLHVPDRASAVVVFAHGSGSGRYSPRNRFVASVLYHAGLGTLLLDLHNVFDMELQAERLTATMEWLAARSDTARCSVGLFGASTGAGAALVAAADAGEKVSAVVSRGGRPDLAGLRLREVTAPTLLIVGGADELVLKLNHHARAELRCPSDLIEIGGASHLFEEPGALGEVALRARDWFVQYLLR